VAVPATEGVGGHGRIDHLPVDEASPRMLLCQCYVPLAECLRQLFEQQALCRHHTPTGVRVPPATSSALFAPIGPVDENAIDHAGSHTVHGIGDEGRTHLRVTDIINTRAPYHVHLLAGRVPQQQAGVSLGHRMQPALREIDQSVDVHQSRGRGIELLHHSRSRNDPVLGAVGSHCGQPLLLVELHDREPLDQRLVLRGVRLRIASM